MKKIRNFAILLAVVLVAGVSIFYACTKENNVVNDAVKNLKKEAEFVARNLDGTCAQVTVFRDENDNARFVTKQVANDPEAIVSFMISDAMKLEPQQSKNDDELVFMIPNDAIYWLVPIEGYEPVKFEPVKDTKTVYGPSSTSISCSCWECTGCAVLNDSHCEKKQTDKGWTCEPKAGGNCVDCRTRVISTNATATAVVMVGSFYLVQSNSITLNGITYN